jgi:hypothetical protein
MCVKTWLSVDLPMVVWSYGLEFLWWGYLTPRQVLGDRSIRRSLKHAPEESVVSREPHSGQVDVDG